MQIYQAITERHHISFKYKGKKRKVQPVALGFTSTGKLCLRAYEMPSGGWKLYDTDKISSVELEEQFSMPKARYSWSGDKQLVKVVVKL